MVGVFFWAAVVFFDGKKENVSSDTPRAENIQLELKLPANDPKSIQDFDSFKLRLPAKNWTGSKITESTSWGDGN